jgi:hypothetical protein
VIAAAALNISPWVSVYVTKPGAISGSSHQRDNTLTASSATRSGNEQRRANPRRRVAMYNRLGDAIVGAMLLMIVLLCIFIPLGIWKLVEIIIWVVKHIHWG